MTKTQLVHRGYANGTWEHAQNIITSFWKMIKDKFINLTVPKDNSVCYYYTHRLQPKLEIMTITLAGEQRAGAQQVSQMRCVLLREANVIVMSFLILLTKQSIRIGCIENVFKKNIILDIGNYVVEKAKLLNDINLFDPGIPGRVLLVNGLYSRTFTSLAAFSTTPLFSSSAPKRFLI